MGTCLEQIENQFRHKQHNSKMHKWLKKQRNRWLRRTPKTEVPNTKLRKGYEY